MAKEFDPYLKWLGIAPKDQPPNHYRLLGIPELIDDADVIENAADRQMAHVRTFASGQHSADSQRILNEIARAKVCLLEQQEKHAYDAQLQAEAASQAPPSPPAQPVLKTRQVAQAQSVTSAAATPMSSAPALSIDSKPSVGLKKRKSTARQAAVVLGLLVVAMGLAWGFYLATTSDQVVADRENEKNTPTEPPVVEPPEQTPPPVVVATPSDDTFPDDPVTLPPVVEKPDDPELTETVSTDKPQDPPEAGESIDLLKRIDVARDVVEGAWKMDRGALVSTGDSPYARVMTAGSIPDEYRLTLELERVSGDNAFVVGLVAEGKQVETFFDYHGPGEPPVSGFINGKFWASPDGLLIKNKAASVITYRVTSARIAATINGKTIFDEPRTPSMGVVPHWNVPKKDVLFLGCQHSSFRIRKFELTPLGDEVLVSTETRTEKGKSIDLLKQIDLKRDVVEGIWKFDGDTLLVPGGANLARLMVPFPVSREYLLDLEVERTIGDNMLFVGLVVRGKQAQVAFDYHAPGQAHHSNLCPRELFGEKAGILLHAGKSHRIRFQVTISRIVVWVDGQVIFDQRERIDELGMAEVWKFPRNDVLCLGSHHAGFRISKFELTPINAGTTDFETSKKLPLPEGPALAKAQATLREVFKDELKAAKTDKDRITLAKTLLDTSADTSSASAETFVMLQAVRKLAAQAGDAQTALTAIDRLGDRFVIDTLEMKGETLSEVAKEVRQQDEQVALVTVAGGVVLEMVAEDRFDLAEPLTKLVQTAAIKSRDVSLRKEVAASMKQFDALQEAYREVESAFKKLQEMPEDPDANLEVGRYRVCVKQDWEQGLANLAAGSDETLKALATEDLAGASSSSDQVKLGDAWWKQAEAESGETQNALKVRAGHWYQQSYEALTGLTKERVTKRLDEIRQLDPSGRIKPDDWVVARGADGRWKMHRFERLTSRFNGGILTATNKQGDRQIAFLVYQPFLGDRPFKAALEIRGNPLQLGLVAANGEYRTIYGFGPRDDMWHTFTIERTSEKLVLMTMDGKKVNVQSWQTDKNLEGKIAVWVMDGQYLQHSSV